MRFFGYGLKHSIILVSLQSNLGAQGVFYVVVVVGGGGGGGGGELPIVMLLVARFQS